MVDIAELYNAHFSKNQSSRVSNLYAELLSEIHTARNAGVYVSLAWPIQLAPAVGSTPVFQVLPGDGRYNADRLVLGPCDSGTRSTRLAFNYTVLLSKDDATALWATFQAGEAFASIAFFDAILVVPTASNEPSSICMGGVFSALPPHRPVMEFSYDHERRIELATHIEAVARSDGMSPAEYRQWLQRETGNDPGSRHVEGQTPQ